jgi:hypothetical protein
LLCGKSATSVPSRWQLWHAILPGSVSVNLPNPAALGFVSERHSDKINDA